MLDLLQDKLPVGKEEWEEVQRIHCQRFPEMDRNADSLKRKFSALYRKQIPTGDPHIPPDVQRAKRIRADMTDRIDLGDGDDAIEIADSSFETESTTRNNVVEAAEDAEILHMDAAPQQGENSVLPRNLPERATPSPRPLVRRRASSVPRSQDDSDLISIYKLSMLEDQKRRAEEHERRLQDREDEKIWRDREEKRHDKYMEMMMMMAFGNRNHRSEPTKPPPRSQQ